MHRFVVVAAIVPALAVSAAAQGVGDRLDALRDKARPVLVLSDAADDPRVAAQIAKLDGAKAGVAARDIVVLREARPGRALRERLGVGKTGFAVVLVGKDGSVKKVWRDLVDPRILFALIDAMPMRREEMKR